MKKKNIDKYLSITYSDERRPKTDYPDKLAFYLFNKYNFIENQKLLDFGCGRGDMLNAFSKMKLETYGADKSHEAKSMITKSTVFEVDAEQKNLDLPEKFDVIFSKSLIEHLKDPVEFLINCKSNLNPNGKVIILTPSWYHHKFGPFYLDHTHVTPFTLHSLRDIGYYAGFKNIDVNYFYQLPFVWDKKILNIVPKLISFLRLPYFPMYEKLFYNFWPENINKLIRFSREVMLISIMKI